MTGGDFVELDLPNLPLGERQQAILAAVAPRPIALAGTLSAEGVANLAPFSFYNVFGANPVYLAISPALGGRDGVPKHTHLNIVATGEFTVSVVSHEIADQANVASFAYPAGVDEFVKAGLTKHASLKVTAPGVAESPCVLECKLFECIELGGKPGSGNLIIGEVVHMRVRRDALDATGGLDPVKLDQVSRLGGEWYSRAKEGLFQLPRFQPGKVGIGFDALPEWLKRSAVLTGSDLARLASVAAIPGEEPADVAALGQAHRGIQRLVREGRVDEAWRVVRALKEEVS